MTRSPQSSSADHPQPSPRPTGWRVKAHDLWCLARFDKPVGILLLLWPTWWGLWLAAEGLPDWPRLLVFTLGTVLMRAAGCVLNDLADRRFDGAVARTAQRRLATGEVSVRQAIALASVLLAASASLLVFLNELARQYAFVAVFVAAAYPYFKRFFPMPQAILGIAFGFGIPMAFADTHGQVPLYAWGLWLSNVAWSIAYDTAYAMVDRDDDRKLGLRSSAITFGRADVLAVSLCQGFVLLVLFALPFMVPLGLAYSAAWVLAVGWSYRLLLRLRSRTREDSFWVFRQSHWVGALIWLGLALDFLL
jgi:4-hydroxybenzoate polyprenyltransferase